MSERIDAGLQTVMDRPYATFAGLLLILALQVGSLWYIAPDSLGYLSTAKNLWQTGQWSRLGSLHVRRVPGYSAAIAPLFAFQDRPFLGISLFHWALTVLLVIGVYRWSSVWGRRAAWFITSLSVGHVAFGVHYRMVLSETQFMVLLVWTAVALNAARRAEGLRFASYCAVGTLLLIGATLTRPIGIFAAAGFAMVMIVDWYRGQRRWYTGLAATLAVGLTASAILLTERAVDSRRAELAGGYTYWDELVTLRDPSTSILGRVPEGARIQMSDFTRTLVPGMFKARARRGEWTDINTLLSFVATAGLVYGWLRLARGRPDVLIWTLPFYCGLNILWACDANLRFILPMFPALLACFWILFVRLKWDSPRFVVPLVAAHVMFAVGYWLAVDLPRTVANNATWAEAEQLCQAITVQHDQVGAYRVPDDTPWLMAIMLDRPIPDLDSRQVAMRCGNGWQTVQPS